MDLEKRQKMMLVAAAVMSIGAGSYWFFGRDSGADRPTAMFEGDTMRKPRAASETPSPPRKPSHPVPAEEEATVPTRKTREETEVTNPGRKPQPRPDKLEKKKPIIRMG